MSDKEKFVVMGEASESEEEDNIILTNYNIPKVGIHSSPDKKQNHVAVISGEASESEDEKTLNQEIAEAAAREKELQESLTRQKLNEQRYNSLLHKKLQERNSNLRKSICEVYNQSTGNAIKQVTSLNELLYRSQLAAQTASVSIHTAKENFRIINEKLKAMLEDSFIPEIKIPDNETAATNSY